jgi:hypothetical protein
MQRGRSRKLFYKGQLNRQELRKPDSLCSITPFEKYDSAYIDEDGFDLASYKIIMSGNKSTGVYVYGTRKAPPALKNMMGAYRVLRKASNLLLLIRWYLLEVRRIFIYLFLL